MWFARGRNNFEEFCAFKAKMAKKRLGKEEPTGSSSDMDYITVQRLSPNVEGCYQKYARIRLLTMVPLGCEPTISNIKEACKCFLKLKTWNVTFWLVKGDHCGLR